MLEELLLVCTFVGTKKEDVKFVRGEDCVAWLHDLQRALRRDESDERPVRVTLGSWKVFRSKLLPLAEESAGDPDATRTLIKIFVLLTMPLTPRAIDSLRSRTDEDQSSLRAAAASQVGQLADARHALSNKPKVLRMLLAFFQAPLSKRASERTDEDARDVELALTLLRNLVVPLPSVSARVDELVASSWDSLVVALEAELVLEVVAELACAVSLRENQPLNLILIEIFSSLFAQHAPIDVVAAEFAAPNQKETRYVGEDGEAEEAVSESAAVVTGPLIDALNRQRATRNLERSTRHPRFGSVLKVMSTPGGRREDKKDDDEGNDEKTSDKKNGGVRCVSGVKILTSRAAVVSGDFSSSQRAGRRRPIFIADRDVDRQRGRGRRKKRVDDCRGEGEERLFAAEDDEDDVEELDGARSATRPEEIVRFPTKSRLGAAARRARKALAALAKRLSTDACGELFESVKRELRLESSRVLPKDKHCFLALGEFFLAWRRERGNELSVGLAKAARAIVAKRDERRNALELFDVEDDEDEDDVDEDIKASYSTDEFFPKTMLRVLDVFSVKTVIDDIDFCLEHRRYREVERSTSVYKEMLRALETLKSGDRTERKDREKLLGKHTEASSYATLVSDGMFERIFFAAEPLDPLPKLLREWKAGRHTKRHACELVELVHVSSKLQPLAYVVKLASANTLDMYTSLVETYADNSPAVNHYVHSFLFKLARVPLSTNSTNESITPTSAHIRTLEPLLYTLRLFSAFSTILLDKSQDRALLPLAGLARDTLRHFDAHASKNPMLYVEALFPRGGNFAVKWCADLAAGYSGGFVQQTTDENDVDDGPKRTLLFGADREEEEEEEEEAEIDFDQTAKWDERAKERTLKKKKLSRWLPREDATLALLLAEEHQDSGSIDSIDIDAIVRLPVLLAHHANATAVKRRIGQLFKQAEKRESDESSSTSDKLRALSEHLKNKAKRKERTAFTKKTTKAKSRKDSYASPFGDDEDDEDEDSEDEDSEDDDSDDDEGPEDTVARKVTRKRKQSYSSPFGDEDEDEDDAAKGENATTRRVLKKHHGATAPPTLENENTHVDEEEDAEFEFDSENGDEEMDEERAAEELEAILLPIRYTCLFGTG